MEFTLFTYRKVKVMNGSKLDTELNIVLEILIQNAVEHIDETVEETNADTHAHGCTQINNICEPWVNAKTLLHSNWDF